MNLLMSGMILTSKFAMRYVAGGDDPAGPRFWFIMSMALIVGFVCAYPINWWLVANHMKHGMLTVRKQSEAAPIGGMTMGAMSGEMSAAQPGAGMKAAMTALTFAILAAALAVVVQYAIR